MNNAEKFLARFGTREQVEHYRDRYTTGKRGHIHRLEEKHLTELLAHVGKIETAMDLPCGTGRLSPALAKVADRVILADAAPKMVEVAREDASGYNAEFLLTPAEDIKLDDGAVDLVFSHRFIRHIKDPAMRKKIFAEFARVSKRYVVLSYYAPGFRSRIRWYLKRLVGKADTPKPTWGRFIDEVADAGLKLVATQSLRRFPLMAAFCLFERTDANHGK